MRYESGVPALDGDHRFLLEMLEELAGAALAGSSAELLEDQSLEVTASLESHFAKEERMLAEACIDDIDGHLTRHGELLDSMAGMTGAYLHGLGAQSAHAALCDFMKALQQEIEEFDRAAAPAILAIPKKP